MGAVVIRLIPVTGESQVVVSLVIQVFFRRREAEVVEVVAMRTRMSLPLRSRISRDTRLSERPIFP